MSKTRLFAIAALMCLCAAGCNDDNVINVNNRPDITPDDCDKQCPSGQVCKDGDCVESGTSEAQNCSKTENTCIDENTVKACVKGKKPVEKACEKGSCFEGECLTECTASKSECASDDILSVCEKGEKPVSVACSKEKIRGACVDGECVSREPAIGLSCEDDAICPEGSYCDYGDGDERICIAYGHVGESCVKAECEQDLICDEDICKKQVSRGELCDELSFCETNMCIHGLCSDYSTLYGDCNDSLLCPSNSICIEHQCVPTKGSCTSNRDCKGDSYCCLDVETCKANVNICVPYSEETTNDSSCVFSTKPGIFEASVQCYWTPKYQPSSSTVINTVVSGKIHNKLGIEKPLIAFISNNYLMDPYIIRILNTETCEEVENITVPSLMATNNLALADLDGDGYMEIVSPSGIYHWDEASQQHIQTKVPEITTSSGFIIHDINNDGKAEIIGSGGEVANHEGAMISSRSLYTDFSMPAVGDLNGDGIIELVVDTSIYQWDESQKSWQQINTINTGLTDSNQTAFADFGTPGKTAEEFDFEHLDGIAEVVITGRIGLQIASFFDSTGAAHPMPQLIFNYPFKRSGIYGYPASIGDFDGDGLPEIGVASSATFGVYDPRCLSAEAGKCRERYVLWESATKDESGLAGASAFDFDGDGKIEIVYGDECFSRVYDGKTGEVLFSSARNSGTSLEYPMIADVDDDGSTEIVISSDISSSCNLTVDSSHRGVKCEDDSDCYSGSCVGGLCRCTRDAQCNWQTINGVLFNQYRCMNPLSGDENGGNVCRAIFNQKRPGIMILRDRLDRWVSSRTLWNQHAYNITNVNDDGSIPKTSDWKQNYTSAGLNNYRQQKQGTTGAGAAPDITGRFTSSANTCIIQNGNVMMTAQVCNRGTKAVGSRMPAVFYKGAVEPQNILCVSYTDEMVPVQGCKMVSCAISAEMAESLSDTKIILKVNDDGKGGKTTVECNEDNNTDEIFMEGCTVIN